MGSRRTKAAEVNPGWRSRIVGHGEEAPDQLLANPRNWRVHPKAQQDALEGMLDQVGWVQDVVVNRRTGYLVDGHLRVAVAISRGETAVPVVYVDLSPEEESLVLAALDPLAGMAVADEEALRMLLAEITVDSEALQAMLDGASGPPKDAAAGAAARPSLADRFLVPPFSVLDARQGYWQRRKEQWLATGIRSELGRGENIPGVELLPRPEQRSCPDLMRGEHIVGERLTWVVGSRPENEMDDTSRKNLAAGRMARPPHGPTVTQNPDGTLSYDPSNNGGSSGTSVFDPVLCEIAYRWFSPPGGSVLDPFAGGSVRGIVASMLGRTYTGLDLSERQIEAAPNWIVGDSADIGALVSGKHDFLFTCPPYADLEVYSDDPRDISTMPYEAFLAAYRGIIAGATALLADDRFACIVVGDIRDRKGIYRNFVSHTIAAFEDAGLRLYNEAILVTAVGSLSIRVGRQFTTAASWARRIRTCSCS